MGWLTSFGHYVGKSSRWMTDTVMDAHSAVFVPLGNFVNGTIRTSGDSFDQVLGTVTTNLRPAFIVLAVGLAVIIFIKFARSSNEGGSSATRDAGAEANRKEQPAAANINDKT